VNESCVDSIRRRIDIETIQLIIVLAPEILGEGGITLLVLLVVLIEAIGHFKEIIAGGLDPLLAVVGNAFQDEEAIFDLPFYVRVILPVYLHFAIVTFEFTLVVLVGNIKRHA